MESGSFSVTSNAIEKVVPPYSALILIIAPGLGCVMWKIRLTRCTFIKTNMDFIQTRFPYEKATWKCPMDKLGNDKTLFDLKSNLGIAVH